MNSEVKMSVLSEGIKCQVNPILMDNESYTKIWLAQEYK